MKNKRLTVILLLILSLTLLSGAAIAIAASASVTDGAYDINSINIAHGDTIKVLIAVDAPIKSSEKPAGGV